MMYKNRIIKYISVAIIQIITNMAYCQPIKLEKKYNLFVNENPLLVMRIHDGFMKNLLEIYPNIKGEYDNYNSMITKNNNDLEYDRLAFMTKILYQNKLPTEIEKINYLYSHMLLAPRSYRLLTLEFKTFLDYQSVIFYYKNRDYYSIFDKPLNLFIFNPHDEPKYISFKNRKEVSYANRNSYKLSILSTPVFTDFHNSTIKAIENQDNQTPHRTKSLPNIFNFIDNKDDSGLQPDEILNRYSLTLKPKKKIVAPEKIHDDTIKLVNLSSNTSAETMTNIFVFLFSPEFLLLLEDIKDNYIYNNKTSFTKVMISNPLFPVFCSQDDDKKFPLFTNIYSLYVTCNPINNDSLKYSFTFYKNIPVQYATYSYKSPDQPLNNNSFTLKDAIQNQFIEIDINEQGYIKYARINEGENTIEFVANLNN